MQYPFQHVRIVPEWLDEKRDLLIAACGPSIYSVDLTDGTLLSQWPCDTATAQVSHLGGLLTRFRLNWRPPVLSQL